MCFGIPVRSAIHQRRRHHSPGDYGITLISRFQLWTQPLWGVLPSSLRGIAWANRIRFTEWRKSPANMRRERPSRSLLFGTAASVCFRWWRRSGEQVDFLRFLPRDAAPREPRVDRPACSGRSWLDHFGALKLLVGSSSPISRSARRHQRTGGRPGATCISKRFAMCCRSLISRWR